MATQIAISSNAHWLLASGCSYYTYFTIRSFISATSILL